MPSYHLNATPPSTVDTGGLGLLSKPLDDPVEQRFVVCEAGHRHGHGEVALRDHSKRHRPSLLPKNYVIFKVRYSTPKQLHSMYTLSIYIPALKDRIVFTGRGGTH